MRRDPALRRDRGARAGAPPGARSFDADAVLLDMDGTLVDSTPVVEAMWTEFAERYGLAPADVLAYAHGRQTADTVRLFLPAGLDAGEVTARFQAEELERNEGIVEVPGARVLLDTLLDAADGVGRAARVAVVTSASRPLAVGRLRAAGLTVPPVLVVGEDVPAGKPDPAGYLLAARRLGAAPARCVAFEDSGAGVDSAVASGARTVVVGRRHPSLAWVPDLRAVRATVRDGAVHMELEAVPDDPGEPRRDPVPAVAAATAGRRTATAGDRPERSARHVPEP